jgi:hypothetical protein
MKVVESNGRIYEIVVLSEGEGDDIVVELTELSSGGDFVGSIRLSPEGLACVDLERTELPIEVFRKWLDECIL